MKPTRHLLAPGRKINRTLCRIAICGLLGAGIAWAAGPARAADKAQNDSILPAQTYLYLSVPNVGELKSRFEKSLTGRLINDPKMADFLGDIGKKFGQLSEMVQGKVGLKIEEILAIPDGEISIAVLLPSNAKKLAVAAILDYGKSGSTVNSLIEKAAAVMEKNGFKKTTRDTERTQVIVYTQTKDKGDEKKEGDKNEEPAFGSQYAYAMKGNTLLVTTGVTAMEDILRGWDGKRPESLAEVPAYKAIMESSKQTHSPPVFVWFLNPVNLVQVGVRSLESLEQGLGMAMAILPILGIDNLKGLGGTLHLNTDEFDSESRTIVYLDRPASGLLSIFQFPPINQAPPKWVKDDSTGYIAINWDVAKAYSAIETLVDNFAGPGTTAQRLEELSNQENLPKIHVKKDVIDNLDGVIHIVTDMPDTNKPESSRVLVAVGVKDSKKVKAILDKVAKMRDFPGQPRDFRGEVIYNLEPIPNFGDANRTMGVSVVNDNLMFSNDVGRIEQIIIGDKDRKPLAESHKYQELAKHFPAKTSVLGYQEQDKPLKAFYEMFRNGKAAEAIEKTQFAKVIEGIDFKKLPDFDAIRQYFPPSGTYVVPQGNGGLMVSFTPKSAK